MPSIATRTGDDGSTSLLFGQRVPKNHPQVEAVGTFDELNAALGFAKAQFGHDPRSQERRDLLTELQRRLVALMGELACAEGDAARFAASKFEKLTAADLARLEAEFARLEALGLKPEGWATPGANALAAALDVARTIARRAERQLVGLPGHGRAIRIELRSYTNRLSDLLWLLAREAGQQG